MEAQELFDKVAKHLLTQKAKAMRVMGYEPRCAYRGEDGKSCAVGCLIDDTEYAPWMEGNPVDWLFDMDLPLTLREKLEGNRGLLLDLQEVHDEYEVENWEQALRNLAKSHDLEFKGYA